MKFIDLFSGIGGFRLGMESAGHECVAFCEIDKFARESYKAIHDTTGETEYHDITSVTDEQWSQFRGTVDIICGGFPCQAFSVAGKRQGFLDETRGTLFFEIARAAKQIKPRILFIENVKGLLSNDKGRTFGVIINTLDELGYDCEWQVLNSKNFGVPQNRERVFIIGHLRGERGREVFPIRESNSETDDGFKIKVVGNTNNAGHGQKSAIYSTDGIMSCLTATDYKQHKQIVVLNKKDGMPHETNRVYSSQGLSPTLNTMQGGGREPKVAIPVLTPDRAEKRQNGRRFKENGEPMFTLTAQDRHGVAVQNPLKGKTKNGWHFEQNIFDVEGLARTLKAGGGSGNIPKIVQKPRCFNKGGEHEVEQTLSSNSWHENNLLKSGIRIRKLTPRECWRLQGFPDWSFDKAQEVNSNSQLYKQAGNSVTVNVIAEIAKKFDDV